MNGINVDTVNQLHVNKNKKSNRKCYIPLLFFYGFNCIAASESEISEKDIVYEKYCLEQKRIEQEISMIPGSRSLHLDKDLAKVVLKSCPKEIFAVISGIEQNIFFDNEKNIILHGLSGTGKSCLAQAIAIQTQTPCLFFNAGAISTEYMNSGIQNLQKIFAYAKGLHKPCVIVLDELEALTKKHASKNNHENNILISFWQELDNLAKNNIIVIGTMNSTEDLPVQVTNRTLMIKVPLPDRAERGAILAHHLYANRETYQLTYSGWVKNSYLALLTRGFSHRDLQNVVTRATKPAILDRNNKKVYGYQFVRALREISKDPKRKLEREIGTWKHSFKKHCRDPKITVPVALGIAGLYGLYNSIIIQKEGLANQKAAMIQSQKIADEQMSLEHMSKQALLNSSIPFLGLPVAVLTYMYANIKSSSKDAVVVKHPNNRLKVIPSKKTIK